MRRFWKTVTVESMDGCYAVLLDGRPFRLPAGRRLLVPTYALADAIADEWRGIPEKTAFDTGLLPLTRIAGTMIERVGVDREGTIATLLTFAGADLLCYRSGDDSLGRSQAEHFGPLLEMFTERYGVTVPVTSGIMPIAIQPELVTALRRALEALSDAGLAAACVEAPALGSLLLALGLVEGWITEKQALDCAFLEERAQMRRWGEDTELLDQLAVKARDVTEAQLFVKLA